MVTGINQRHINTEDSGIFFQGDNNGKHVQANKQFENRPFKIAETIKIQV